MVEHRRVCLVGRQRSAVDGRFDVAAFFIALGCFLLLARSIARKVMGAQTIGFTPAIFVTFRAFRARY
jgi:hypothetical protein